MTITSAPQGARARVRAELTREIKSVAREQLAEVGAAALSLRAVAREMNMASSAVYRYFPSRDELLTALIVDAYDAVGAAAELDEADARRTDFAGRWMATARAVREWAITHPQEFALIYGSPVPGYRAPLDTIDPAARIPLLLLGIVNDCAEAGKLLPAPEQPMPKVLRTDLTALGEQAASELTAHQLARVARGYVELIGTISFELFGHLHNVIHDYSAHFDFQMRRVTGELGLTSLRRP
jgi:AcrR family transcriptional regulator